MGQWDSTLCWFCSTRFYLQTREHSTQLITTFSFQLSLCRSCERSLRSLDQDSPPKKKKLQPTYMSTTHLLAGKKCPFTLQTKCNDMETTVFYIPGVDVKVRPPPPPPSHNCPNISDLHSLFIHFHLIPVALQLQDPEDRVTQRLPRLLPPSHALQRVQTVWYER